ncbi:uncharacterized protein LOC133184030 [Saccostrea echinata]|uniref:uncharacterized protein LOC133184029 n=1 Tax=Saccostrea echinata TaxID=191078 RepID=UPI002A8204D5|nr:uncharacterized protein LOC133184029 [Saccostrea echinata]XP_061174884.1 uncharacterized protein LOC133184030 [Saccostrea echinata]
MQCDAALYPQGCEEETANPRMVLVWLFWIQSADCGLPEEVQRVQGYTAANPSIGGTGVGLVWFRGRRADRAPAGSSCVMECGQSLTCSRRGDPDGSQLQSSREEEGPGRGTPPKQPAAQPTDGDDPMAQPCLAANIGQSGE